MKYVSAVDARVDCLLCVYITCCVVAVVCVVLSTLFDVQRWVLVPWL